MAELKYNKVIKYNIEYAFFIMLEEVIFITFNCRIIYNN